MSQLQYWVWLSMRFGVRPKVKLALVEHFGTPRDVYFATEADYRVCPTAPGGAPDAAGQGSGRCQPCARHL